jgi:membrane fusion protein, copper/silver efflux system
MRYVALIVTLATSLFIVSCSHEQEKKNIQQADTVSTPSSEYYTCSMHPSVISDKPGACPICGMTLVKKTRQHEASSNDIDNLKAITLSPTQRVLANVATAPA